MIVTCPACDAQYLLPDDAVGPKGRRVKCTSCAYTWLQPPEAAASEEETHFHPESYQEEKYREPPVRAQRPVLDPRQVVNPPESVRFGRIMLSGLIVAIVLSAITAGFLVAIRQKLSVAWPPAALLFEKMHIAVSAPGAGFALEKLEVALEPADKPEKLMIRGVVTNASSEERFLPGFLVRASGKQGWLKDWPIHIDEKMIAPGASIAFQYHLADPPLESQDVTVRFAGK